jgi:fluoride exporter
VRVLVWIAVGLAGGFGALVRFGLDAFLSERAPSSFPFGTLSVNASGAALLGLLAGVALHGDALLVAGTGVLGSYTTFSTWLFETHRLGEDGELWMAALNVVVSLAVGLGAVALGRAIG